MVDALTVPIIKKDEAPAPVSAPLAVEADDLDPAAPAPVAPPAEPANDLDTQADDAVRAVLQDKESGAPAEDPIVPNKMQASMALAIGTNPDAQAEAKRVAERTGVPIETVFAHPEEMKRKAALDDINFDTYQKLYPASAEVLADPEIAKLAHDDTENMGYTENVLRGIGGRTVNLGGSLLRVTGTIAQNIGKRVDDYVPTVLDFRDGMELRHMTPEERAMSTPIDQTVRKLENFDLGYAPRTTWDDVKNRPLSEFLPFALEQGLVSAPDMAAAIFVPEAYFVSLTGDIGQTRAENDKREQATVGDFIKAAPAAAVNALLERFATKGILGIDDTIKALKEIPKAIGKAALKEGATEAFQNAAQYAGETVATQKGFDPAEAADQALQGVVAGGPFGGMVRGATGGVEVAVERTRHKVREATVAEQNGRDFDQLNALAAESKLKTRDTLTFQKFVEQVSKQDGAIENVFIDPRALAQSGINIEELAAVSPSVAAQVGIALETGSDVKIPMSEYASHLAGTELGQAMVDHLKTNPLGMSRAEAREFMQSHSEQLKNDVQKAMADFDVDDTFQKSADAVRENVLGQLKTANRFTEEVNGRYATLLSNFYKVQAARLGTTPEAFFQAHPVNIQSVFDKGATLEQDAENEAPPEGFEQFVKIAKKAKDTNDFIEKVRKVTGVPSSTSEWFMNRYGNGGFDMRQASEKFVNEVKSGTFKQGKDEARGSFNPDTNTITLLKRADLSTFLHESGHFFLEVMNKMALDPNAPEAIKADMQTTLDWLGVKDLAEWNSHDLEWQREKHEQFARGFEAYLFEGKSPSAEMRQVFQRFRAWLLNVYRNLRNLDVELNDEVRAVFDRMLATSEQIKETELARSFEPMFKDAATAGMTAEEWQQYQEMGIQATQDATAALETRSMRDMKFLSNAKSRVLKDLQRQAAGRRREVREQVTKEIMSEPVNQARTFLTKGEINGEKMLEGGTKLSLFEIEAMYGDNPIVGAIKKKLGYGKFGMLGEENAIHPDQVAEMFGFSSGDELVRELLSAENPKERIAAATDLRMLEKYGDLTDPEVIARAADAAIHNEVRTRFVATEMNALQRAIGGRKILAEAARRFAENMINGLRVRDIQPGRYSAAETRAARAADVALRKGNLPEAAVEKRNQLIQNYAARAAHAAQSEIEKAIRYFRKFEREGTRSNVDSDYLDQIDTLLDRFDLRKSTSLKAIDKRKSLLAWKEAQEDIGIEPEIPPELLDEAMRKSYKDMTLEELRGLRDTVKQIEHLGRLKNKLLTAKDDRDFKATVAAMVESINTHSKGRVVDNRTRATRKDQAIRLFKGFVASHRKVASLARELDGVKDGGPVWETLIRSMNAAGDKEATMRAAATKELGKLIKPILSGEKMGGKGRYFETIGKSLNREERIGLALNTGNLGNLQRLLDGEGWTIDQIRPVLDSLTKEDWDFVQSTWDFFETFRPEIGAKEKRVYGKEPDWVEPNPVQTPFGEYRGGYYPIKYDTRRSIAAEQHSDAEFAKQQMKGAYTSATTRRSFTKSRADEVKGRPLLYAMDGLYSGVNEVIHDLAWHEWLIDANRLLKNKSLDGAIRNGFGADVVRQFKDSVRDIAGGEMPTGTSFEKGIADLRGGAVVAGLGLNIVNTVINITGVTNSIVRVGPKWVAMGVAKWTANPLGTTSEVHQKSEFMRNRAKTMTRELNEIQSMVRGKSKTRAVMDTMMFAPLTMTQIAVDVPTWWGAYQKALTEGNADERAIALADQAVLDAQSGGQVKDLAGIQRGGPIMKLFTTFYGYFNAAYNLGVERTKATNFKDPLSVLKLGGDYLMLYTVPAVMGGLIKNALIGDDDDWEPENVAKMLANEQISYLMGLMVGLRELTGAVQTVAGVNPYTSGYGGPAGLRFFQEFYKLGQQISQGEGDEALRKSAINVLGIVFKLPAAQINRTIGGVEALLDGDTENPAAVIAGPPKK